MCQPFKSERTVNLMGKFFASFACHLLNALACAKENTARGFNNKSDEANCSVIISIKDTCENHHWSRSQFVNCWSVCEAGWSRSRQVHIWMRALWNADMLGVQPPWCELQSIFVALSMMEVLRKNSTQYPSDGWQQKLKRLKSKNRYCRLIRLEAG